MAKLSLDEVEGEKPSDDTVAGVEQRTDAVASPVNPTFQPKGVESKRSRPPPVVQEAVVRMGTSGTPLELATNSIRLKVAASAEGLWEYHVSFQPELDKRVRRREPWLLIFFYSYCYCKKEVL